MVTMASESWGRAAAPFYVFEHQVISLIWWCMQRRERIGNEIIDDIDDLYSYHYLYLIWLLAISDAYIFLADFNLLGILKLSEYGCSWMTQVTDDLLGQEWTYRNQEVRVRNLIKRQHTVLCRHVLVCKALPVRVEVFGVHHNQSPILEKQDIPKPSFMADWK